MFKRIPFVAAALLICAVAFAESAMLPTPSAAVLQLIRPEAIRAHMQFLSDDLMEGRETGTRGYMLAANYIRSQFQTIGLKPGGANGSYFQQVPLRRSRLVREQSSVVVNRNGKKTKLIWEQNFAMRGSTFFEKTGIEA